MKQQFLCLSLIVCSVEHAVCRTVIMLGKVMVCFTNLARRHTQRPVFVWKCHKASGGLSNNKHFIITTEQQRVLDTMANVWGAQCVLHPVCPPHQNNFLHKHTCMATHSGLYAHTYSYTAHACSQSDLHQCTITYARTHSCTYTFMVHKLTQ